MSYRVDKSDVQSVGFVYRSVDRYPYTKLILMPRNGKALEEME